MHTDRIDHLTFLTKDLDTVVNAWAKFTGVEPMFEDDNTETDGVKEVTFLFPHGIVFQQVTDETKPYAASIKDLPEGIHTMTIAVQSMKDAKPEMEALGYSVIRERVNIMQGAKFCTYNTYEDLGFNVEVQQWIDMFDYGYDETEVKY